MFPLLGFLTKITASFIEPAGETALIVAVDAVAGVQSKTT